MSALTVPSLFSYRAGTTGWTMIETIVFVLAGIIGLITLSFPWLAIEWWEATRQDDDRKGDDES